MKVAEAVEKGLVRGRGRPRPSELNTQIYTSLLIYISLLDDDVYQSVRNDANLDNLFACDRGAHFLVCEGSFFDVFFRRVGGDHNAAAQLVAYLCAGVGRVSLSD